MQINKKIIIITASLIVVPCILLTAYIFNKLESYKKEIQRLHGYHTAVIKRHDEDIRILFNRLNCLESKQQDMTDKIGILEYRSYHKY